MTLAAKLRRIALDRQGLLRKDHFGRGKQATLRAIKQIGYVQIDTISVVERAHHHVLRSRVANYQSEHLHKLVQERQVFEYWFHAAAWLPMSDYRFALPRIAEVNGYRSWFPQQNPKLVSEILRRIETEGPLRARDFEDQRKGSNGWWDWKPAKQALEQLFMQGELMVSAREGFQKRYDLPERVLPDWVNTTMPTVDEYACHLLDTTLRAHGFANLKSVTYLRKGQKLRDAVRQQVAARVNEGRLVEFNLDGQSYFADPELLETRAPRSVAQVSILSPFDNSLIQRERTQRVFDYDYQIECYLPEHKRQFGYFCLPLLYRDRFVGRINCKAHREQRYLEVRDFHLERKVDDGFAKAFDQSLTAFAEFNGCDEVRFREVRQDPRVPISPRVDPSLT